jgi:subtilisin family serine protease
MNKNSSWVIQNRHCGHELPSYDASNVYSRIHPVRIDDGDPGARDGDIIDGINWVLSNHLNPAVINLSYGDNGCQCTGSFAVRDALQSLVNNGVVVAKSAGNGNRDAYQYRPNRVSPAFIVAAAGWSPLTQSLFRMDYSNYGSTISIYAPGNSMYAATSDSDNSYTVGFGGTSGASPFVAGVVAQILEAYPYLGPSDVDYWIKHNSTANVVSATMPGDPNLFLARW